MTNHRLANWLHRGSWPLMAGMVLLWWQLPGSMAALLFLPAWFVSAQVIFLGSHETARLKRRAWLGQYLVSQSPWHRLLQGGAFMVIVHQLLSAALALALLVMLRQAHPVDMAILLATLGVFLLVAARLNRIVQAHIVPRYQSPLVRRSIVPLVALPLTLALAIAHLTYPQPYLIGLPWVTALQHHVTSSAADSLLGTLERIALVSEISALWAIQNSIEMLELSNSKAKPAAWLFYFVTQSILAWSFVRLLTGKATLGYYLRGYYRGECDHRHYRHRENLQHCSDLQEQKND